MTKPSLFVLDSMAWHEMLLEAKHGPALCAAAKVSGISAQSLAVWGMREFRSAFSSIQLISQTVSERYPLVHVACHGSEDGLQLMSGETMSWETLAEIVRPLHVATNQSLVLGLSSCFGSKAGPAMAWLDRDLPCRVIFGPRHKIAIGEAAIAWSVLYHNLATPKDGHTSRKLVYKMNVAIDKSAADGFTYFDEHRRAAVVEQCKRRFKSRTTLATRA